MSLTLMRICFGLLAWTALLFGSLSLAHLPGDWGHGICGPWGCGPATQALVACHTAWLVILAPLALLMLRARKPTRRNIGLLLVGLAVVMLLGFVAYERLYWWPGAPSWQRPYFWQRCGFCVLTSVDIPVLQTLLLGALLIVRPQRAATAAETT